EARQRLGAGAQRLGEEAKWTRGRPEELVAGGIGEWWSMAWGFRSEAEMAGALCLVSKRSGEVRQGWCVLKAERRVTCELVLRLSGVLGRGLERRGGEWTGRRWRVSAMSSDAAQRLGRPCFHASTYS